MIQRISLGLLILFLSSQVFAQPSSSDIRRVISEVNHLRSKGFQCGSQKMSPAPPLEWDHTLYLASRQHAVYMSRTKHFSHFTKDGRDLGDRLDALGYTWNKVGENIGVGFRDFYGVMKAWLKSPSHCEMLFDPEVNKMGLSKHQSYWVQSFSKPVSSLE